MPARYPDWMHDEMARLRLEEGLLLHEIAARLGVSIPWVVLHWPKHPKYRKENRGQMPVTERQRRIVAKVMLSGRSIHEAMKASGLGEKVVERVWRECPDWRPGRACKSRRPEVIERVGALILAGHYIAEVADITGFSNTVIQNAWKNHPRHYKLPVGKGARKRKRDAQAPS